MTNNNMCTHCPLEKQLCNPVGINDERLNIIDELVVERTQLKTHEHLFQQNNIFRGFYAVRSGAFKSYTITPDGRERVHSFYLPGELIGLDAVDSNQYLYSVQSLQASSACQISFEQLLKWAGEIPSLQKQLLCLMSQNISNEVNLVHNSSAEEKVAYFLLNLAGRLKKHNRSQNQEYILPMSRKDIGNYLGIASETVSRILAQFQKQNILTTSGKQLQLVNLRQLQVVACCDINHST